MPLLLGELSNTYQTNAIQMPNNLYQITSAKYQMLKNCETHYLSDEKSLKHENTKEQSESVTVPEQCIDKCIRKPEFQNRIRLQSSSKFTFECCGNRQFSNACTRQQQNSDSKFKFKSSGSLALIYE